MLPNCLATWITPSSKKCSHCDYTAEKMPLFIRVWQSPNCDNRYDRDINDAKNIRNMALADELGRSAV